MKYKLLLAAIAFLSFPAISMAESDADTSSLPEFNHSIQNRTFQILRMNSHSANLVFLGSNNESKNGNPEIYQVRATPDTDLKHATIRKMIEIIRRNYSGDFNWQSQRLQRVLVLSARLQDNELLESFLMKEFFDS